MKNSVGMGGRVLITMGFLLLAMTVFPGCSKDSNDNSNTGSGSPGTNEVWMQGTAFVPSTITVPVGTKVTWTNKDGIPHTVTSNSGLFNSGNLNNKAIFSYTFLSAGTYPYHCSIHPTMTGTIVVN